MKKMMGKNEILIVPLGPDDGSLMTVGACEALKQAERVILRTAQHGTVHMPIFETITYESLDRLYDQTGDFDELCCAAAAYLIEQAEQGSICYAVPDPLGDATVRALFEMASESVLIRMMGGVTVAMNLLATVAPYGVNYRPEHIHVSFAMDLGKRRVQMEPQVICEINDRMLASDVKLWLSDLYEDDTEILFVRNAASSYPEVRKIYLYDLDRQSEYDHRTAIFVPETDVLTRSRASFEDLVKLIAYLRSPDGCPWDRAQTHKTLRRCMIEEACEAAEAMGTGDAEKIADELGDVLLQIILNAQIGAEHRMFTDRDVTSAITRKMVSRHEHIFGDAQAETPEATGEVWERAKEKEHGKQSLYERLTDLPKSLPVLLKTQKVLKREAETKHVSLDAIAAGKRAQSILERVDEMTEEQFGVCLEALCEIAEVRGLDADSSLQEYLRRRIESLKTV